MLGSKRLLSPAIMRFPSDNRLESVITYVKWRASRHGRCSFRASAGVLIRNTADCLKGVPNLSQTHGNNYILLSSPLFVSRQGYDSIIPWNSTIYARQKTPRNRSFIRRHDSAGLSKLGYVYLVQ